MPLISHSLLFTVSPFYFIAKTLNLDPFWGLIFFAHLLILSIFLLFYKINLLFFKESTALKLTILAITTPYLLYYQKTFYIEPFVLLLHLILFYIWAKNFKNKFTAKESIFIGLIFWVGLTTKYVFVISIFVFLFLSWWKKMLTPRISFILLFFLSIGIFSQIYYKSWRFPAETIFPPGYSINTYLSYLKKYFWEGLSGLLISPGKGLFITFPLTLLSILTTIAILKKDKRWIFPLTLFFAYYIFYSGWEFWDGSFCHGPRFLVSVYLLLIIPLGYLIENLSANFSSLWKWIFIILYISSVYINIQFLRIDDNHFYQTFCYYLVQVSPDIKKMTLSKQKVNNKNYLVFGDNFPEFDS